MKFYNDLVLRFENSDWCKNPEFGVIDTILELHPDIFNIFKSDIIGSEETSNFDRKDTPSVEQIARQPYLKR